MIKKFFILLLTAMLCVGCISVQFQTPRLTHVVPHVFMEVHADISFTLHERELIQMAVDRIYDQTNGFVEYKVIYDLDFDSITSLKEHARHNILTRTNSTAPDLEKDTIGYCIVNYNDLDFNNPTKAALVHDRLPTDAAWVHVAMHEMLHMIRLKHVGEKKSILYKSTPVHGLDIVTCLTPADVKEICTVHGCDPVAMKPCNP